MSRHENSARATILAVAVSLMLTLPALGQGGGGGGGGSGGGSGGSGGGASGTGGTGSSGSGGAASGAGAGAGTGAGAGSSLPGAATTPGDPRPGADGRPGHDRASPHFNDPYYRRTEPQRFDPGPQLPGSSRSDTGGSAPLQRGEIGPSPDPEIRGSAASGGSSGAQGRERNSAGSLAECYGNWDPSTRMSRETWEQTCRRLDAGGRIGK